MKCQKCGEDTFLPFQCIYCGGKFCVAHRLPENHACPKMAIARLAKQEATVPETPIFNERTVTFEQPHRAKGRIYFSIKELKHLAVAASLIVLMGIFSWLYAVIFSAQLVVPVIALIVILTLSFFIHELAYKIAAQRRGWWAEFRLTLWGSVLTLITAITPLFKIISPGSVMLSGSAEKSEMGKIFIAGPAASIVLSTVLLSLALFPSPYAEVFAFGAFFNAWVALFNLIPVWILAGHRIWSWNKRVWALAFAVALALAVPAYILVSPYIY